MRPFNYPKLAAAVVALPLAALSAGCESNGGGGGGGGGMGDLLDFGGLTGSSSSPDRVAFRCDDDRRFRVNYNDDGDEAVVDAGDNTYRLELRDRDGDRREYEGERATLTADGDDARLRISGDDDFTDCERA